MKKILIAFAAFAALVACQKVETVTPAPATRYSFNIDVNGANSFDGIATKAVKTGWEAGDMVFVFFKEGSAILSDIYAEMTFDGTAWKAVQRGDGSLGEAGNLTAVYVPFADSSVKPEFADGKWNIAGGDVYFTQASNVPYTVSANTVNATIDMALAEGYVQFYITGINAGEILTCDKIDAYDTISVGDDMTVTSAKKGAGMTGRAYKEGTVFYGKYNGKTAPLSVLTITKEGKVYKMLKARNVEAGKAYTFGAFAEGATSWTLAPDMLPGLFTVAPGKQVRFSKGNLYYDGASSKFAFEADGFALGCIDAGGMGMLVDGHRSYIYWSADPAVATAGSYADPQASVDDKFFANESNKLNINGESWFNLTGDEWKYLLKERNQDRYYLGKVNGATVTLLVPDGFVWDESKLGAQPDKTVENPDYNALWALNAGIVALPTSGMLLSYFPFGLAVGSGTYLWTASSDTDPRGAIAVAFGYEGGEVKCNIAGEGRDMGASIRLVADPQFNPTAI